MDRQLVDWRKPDGSRPNLKALGFDEGELCPPDLFSSMEPSDLSFYEATGNEGASFERSYRFAALVLWPRGRSIAVIAHSAGFSTTIPLLDELVRQWEREGGDEGSAVCRDALELAHHIQHQWPGSEWQRLRLSRIGDTGRFLACLSRLGAVETTADFIQQVVVTGAYTKADNEALVQVLEQVAEFGRNELLNKLFRQNAAASPAACADLLRRLAHADYLKGKTDALRNPAELLVEVLPKAAKSKQNDYRRQLDSTISGELVVDLLAGLEPIDPELGSKLAGLEPIDPELGSNAVDWLLNDPDVIDMDGVLLPAALELRKLDEYRESVSVIRLSETVASHLRRRIAEPLAPPADWSRPSNLSCRCSQCTDVSRFLADAMQSEWQYKAAQARRSHLEESIRKSHCDIDCHTETKGRPYTLVCRKNQNSYNRRVEQRKRDEQDLAELEQVTG
jgi:hypothetical protein